MLIKMPKRRVTPAVLVDWRILILRHQKVILDTTVAERGRALRRARAAAESADQAEPGKISARFFVSGHSKGRPGFKITICDLN